MTIWSEDPALGGVGHRPPLAPPLPTRAAGAGMIELPVDTQLMRALHRFLKAADDGATLQRIDREGETILYFRKNGRLEEKLARSILAGKADNSRQPRSPILRLIHTAGANPQAVASFSGKASAQLRRQDQISNVENRVPGIFSGSASRALANRRAAPPK